MPMSPTRSVLIAIVLGFGLMPIAYGQTVPTRIAPAQIIPCPPGRVVGTPSVGPVITGCVTGGTGGGGIAVTTNTIRGDGAGNAIAVTGTAGNCVLVNGSSAPCGVGNVLSVFGRTGAVIAQTGDYVASQVTNAADTSLSYSNPSWITSFPWSKITGIPTFFYQTFQANTTPVTQRTAFNLAAGSNIVITPTDDGSTTTFTIGVSGAGVPYSAPVTAQTTLSVSAATHHQGSIVTANCFNAATHVVYCDYTVDGSGNVVFAWNPAFTGSVGIFGNSGGGGGGGSPGGTTNSVQYNTGSGFGGAINSTGTNKLLTQVSGGVPAWNQLVSGDIPNNAANTTGTALNVTGIVLPANGGTGIANTATETLGTTAINWATLGTGIVKNTTTTGAKTLAVAADVVAIFSGCSGVQYLGADGACHVTSGAGSVTSVSFTGGLISVATPTSTPALTIAGTSGGIPYFSSASTWASSGPLTANAVVLGGGAGVAPTVTASDSTTTHALFATAGAPAFRAISGADITTGIVAPANGGSGVANTVTHTLGTSNQNWATLGTGIVKNTTTTGALSNAASTDIIALFSGCSGILYLGADGACHASSGTSTVADVKQVPSANCNNATPGAGWSLGSAGTINCDSQTPRSATNNLGGYITITTTASTFATFQYAIPEDWASATNPYIRFEFASPDATNGHTVIPNIQVACYAGNGSTTDDVAPNAAHTSSTVTLNGNANRYWSTSNVQMNSTDMTGCIAGSLMQVTVGLNGSSTATGGVNFYGATITTLRNNTTQAN